MQRDQFDERYATFCNDHVFSRFADVLDPRVAMCPEFAGTDLFHSEPLIIQLPSLRKPFS
jgi:hypothetical protein